MEPIENSVKFLLLTSSSSEAACFYRERSSRLTHKSALFPEYGLLMNHVALTRRF